jgi:ribosomal protein S18 acetylase RimI-like enzyme
MNELQYSPIEDPAHAPFELLELADPSRSKINDYLQKGQCFVALLNAVRIGVFVLQELSPDTIEIKNMAVGIEYQGRGYGKQLLRQAATIARKAGYQKIIIATGNSSIGQLALYQKAGFEMTRLELNYFLHHYDQPIIENGIPCKHLIVLEKVVS